MSYRVAIIGCGGMGANHAIAWQDEAGATIAAVFDPDAERAKALANKTGARVCTTAEQAVVEAGVDMVSVCTPICFHADVSCLAMAHGRHVLCEKAMALTLADADRMIAASEANNVKLCISYQHRSQPDYAAYQQLVQAGAFGGPVFARFVDTREVRPKLAMHRKSMNGGPVLDMAGHFFDLMRFFTGMEPQTVYARGHVFGADKPRLAGIDDPAVDAAEILVDFEKGHVLSVCVNWGMPEGHPGVTRSELVGPVLLARPAEHGAEAVFADRTETVQAPADAPRGVAARVRDLVTAIETDTQPEVAGADGRKALAVCLGALESIETGAVVEVA